MWLRDYLSLPIAGKDDPTPRLLLNIFPRFLLIGLWHGAGANIVAWAVFSSAWLALEAVGLGARLERLPRVLRHGYVLLVAGAGWMILRAGTHAQAWTFMQAMVGAASVHAWTATRYMSPGAWAALLVAVIGAGPLVPWISRWRVTLDASAAALVMMITALSLFIFRPIRAARVADPPPEATFEKSPDQRVVIVAPASRATAVSVVWAALSPSRKSASL